MLTNTPTTQPTAPDGIAVQMRGLAQVGAGVLAVVSNKFLLSSGLGIGPKHTVGRLQGSIG